MSAQALGSGTLGVLTPVAPCVMVKAPTQLAQVSMENSMVIEAPGAMFKPDQT